MFLEISQNSQKNTCVSVSFLHPFIKKESPTEVFSCEFWEHLSMNTIFYRTTQVAAPVKTCNFTKMRLHQGHFFVNFLLCRWLFRKINNTINCDDDIHALCLLILGSLLKFHLKYQCDSFAQQLGFSISTKVLICKITENAPAYCPNRKELLKIMETIQKYLFSKVKHVNHHVNGECESCYHANHVAHITD